MNHNEKQYRNALSHQGKLANELLNRKDLATRWKVSVATIIRREHSGILKPIYLGPRQIRFRMEDILEIEFNSMQS